MKKLTLNRLKKRPALFQYRNVHTEIGCIFPDGKMYFYSTSHSDWGVSTFTAEEWLTDNDLLFLGWL
jgi:hypothetical protein